MRTRNAMRLKARVNARAKEAGIPAQMMMHARKARLAPRSLEHGAAA